MSIFDLFRSKEKPDLDQSVLIRLQKSGSNVSKPHSIEFLLYFSTQSAAEKAEVSIRSSGFEVEVKKAAQGESWLCFATKTMVPALPDLQKIRHDFMTIAASMNGEYDGWGTQVVK